MPTKKEALEALVATGVLPLVGDGETPHGVNGVSQPDRWNQSRQALKAGYALIGDDFADTDSRLTALQARFDSFHDPEGTPAAPDEWIEDVGIGLLFLSASQFQLNGDRRPDFARGHRVRAHLGANTVIAAVTAVLFASGATTVTLDANVLTSQLNAVDVALSRYSVPKTTAADMMPGSATPNRVTQIVPHSNFSDVGSEHVLVELPALTTRGGVVLLQGTIGVWADVTETASFRSVVLRIRRDTLDPEPVVQQVHGIRIVATGITTVPFLLPTLAYQEVPPAGTHTYRVTAQIYGPNNNGLVVRTMDGTLAFATNSPIDRGRFGAVELA